MVLTNCHCVLFIYIMFNLVSYGGLGNQPSHTEYLLWGFSFKNCFYFLYYSLWYSIFISISRQNGWASSIHSQTTVIIRLAHVSTLFYIQPLDAMCVLNFSCENGPGRGRVACLMLSRHLSQVPTPGLITRRYSPHLSSDKNSIHYPEITLEIADYIHAWALEGGGGEGLRNYSNKWCGGNASVVANKHRISRTLFKPSHAQQFQIHMFYLLVNRFAIQGFFSRRRGF